jgi:hypothetical protein
VKHKRGGGQHAGNQPEASRIGRIWRTLLIRGQASNRAVIGAQAANACSELVQQERSWVIALQKHDSAALSRLLHDEFSSTSARSTGEILRKREYIEAALRMTICNYEIRDVTVYEVAQTAVVKARLICNSNFNGHDIHDDLLITDVWLRSGENWSAVTRHASQIP